MIIVRHILSLACLGIGLGCTNDYAKASEPSIYQNMLTPSPLGKDRILVFCFVKKNDSHALKLFLETVLWDEFSERDLKLVEVSKIGVSTIKRDSSVYARGVINGTRHHDYGDELRKRANCKNEFEFVLIGKDTGVKARWNNKFSQEDLFNRIDAMPMRRFEIQQKQE